MVYLARAMRVVQPVTVAASTPLPHPVVTPAPRSASGLPAPAQRRRTPNQTAFYAAVESVSPEEAVQEIQDARTADSTKGTCRGRGALV